jgi:hypothetical protein
VFDRFTEKARRSIFFARYEASTHPTSFIEPEHLLLGVLREYSELARRAPVEEFRTRIAEKLPRGETVATSVDMPLSKEAQRALSRGAQEADRLGHRNIECGHLVLGLIHESTFVAELLKEWMIDAATIEHMLATPMASALKPPGPLAADTPIATRLVSLIQTAESQFLQFSESEADVAVGQKGWSRKEALGHLIDWASTHHLWLARALTEPKPAFGGYPQDEWIAAMGYETYVWTDMIPLWTSLNYLLTHTVARIPEEKIQTMVRIGVEPPIPLSSLLERYVIHCRDVVAEILTRGHHS